jgi:hypothetical protein
MFTPEDAFLMDYAQKLVYNSDSKITVMDSNNHMGGHFVMESAVESLQTKYPANISLKTDKIMKREFLDRQDLMIISLESWKTRRFAKRLAQQCAVGAHHQTLI